MKPPVDKKTKKRKPWYEVIKRQTGKDPRVCPVCREGLMAIVAVIEPQNKRAPRIESHVKANL